MSGLVLVVTEQRGGAWNRMSWETLAAGQQIAAALGATVQAAVAPHATPADIVQPGHIFPLAVKPGGVLTRAGHTEAASDYARLAGLLPAAVIADILTPQGTLADGPALREFATQHGLKIGSIADLIHFRMVNERTIRRIREGVIDTEYGEFKLTVYHEQTAGEIHLALSRGEIRCIGATTPAEYRKYIEKDRSLERRFQAIKVDPPTEKETVQVLMGVKDRYESFHHVEYTNEAIEAAVYQSSRYITDRFLPDKAIDLIDEAGARAKLREAEASAEMGEINRSIRMNIEQIDQAISERNLEKAWLLRDQEAQARENLHVVRERLDRLDEAGIHRPVIFITAHDDLHTRHAARGGASYLTKPFTGQALIQAIDAALKPQV